MFQWRSNDRTSKRVVSASADALAIISIPPPSSVAGSDPRTSVGDSRVSSSSRVSHLERRWGGEGEHLAKRVMAASSKCCGQPTRPRPEPRSPRAESRDPDKLNRRHWQVKQKIDSVGAVILLRGRILLCHSVPPRASRRLLCDIAGLRRRGGVEWRQASSSLARVDGARAAEADSEGRSRRTVTKRLKRWRGGRKTTRRRGMKQRLVPARWVSCPVANVPGLFGSLATCPTKLRHYRRMTDRQRQSAIGNFLAVND